jgi:hypothetical protein
MIRLWVQLSLFSLLDLSALEGGDGTRGSFRVRVPANPVT